MVRDNLRATKANSASSFDVRELNEPTWCAKSLEPANQKPLSGFVVSAICLVGALFRMIVAKLQHQSGLARQSGIRVRGPNLLLETIKY